MRNRCYQRPRDRHKICQILFLTGLWPGIPLGELTMAPRSFVGGWGHPLPRYHPLDLWHHVRGASFPPPYLHKCSRAPGAQSGGQAKKSPISSWDFVWKCYSCSSVHRIIHCDVMSSSTASYDVVLCCCLKPIASPVSRADSDKQSHRLQ